MAVVEAEGRELAEVVGEESAEVVGREQVAAEGRVLAVVEGMELAEEEGWELVEVLEVVVVEVEEVLEKVLVGGVVEVDPAEALGVVCQYHEHTYSYRYQSSIPQGILGTRHSWVWEAGCPHTSCQIHPGHIHNCHISRSHRSHHTCHSCHICDNCHSNGQRLHCYSVYMKEKYIHSSN